jgi:hypothetical protein
MFDDILGSENEIIELPEDELDEVDEIIYDDQLLPTDDGSELTLEEVLEEVKDFFDYHAEKE